MLDTAHSEVFSSGQRMEALADEVFNWGVNRGITKENGASPLSQLKKLKEEVLELERAIAEDDLPEFKDGVGDVTVVLLQMCRLANVDFVDCLAGAVEEISQRKGRMVYGVFVKDA